MIIKGNTGIPLKKKMMSEAKNFLASPCVLRYDLEKMRGGKAGRKKSKYKGPARTAIREELRFKIADAQKSAHR